MESCLDQGSSFSNKLEELLVHSIKITMGQNYEKAIADAIKVEKYRGVFKGE